MRGLGALSSALGERLHTAPPVDPDGVAIDLEAWTLCRSDAALKRLEPANPSVATARRRLDGFVRAMDYPVAAEVSVEKTSVDGPRGAIPVRVYRRRDARSPKPGLVYLHGGGFVVGSAASHQGVCAKIAERADLTVVSVDYRLAPEHPYPAGYEDSLAAYRAVVSSAARFSVRPDRVAVGGDSAGGNLAAAVALATREDTHPPALQLLVYPTTDFVGHYDSMDRFGDGFLLTHAMMDWFTAHYFRARAHRSEPSASVLRREDLSGAAPAHLVLGRFDPLHDEGLAYGEKLRASGASVVTERYPLPHGFFTMGAVLPSAHAAVTAITDDLRAALHRA